MSDLIGGFPNKIRAEDIKLRRITSNKTNFFQIIFNGKDDQSRDPQYFIIPNNPAFHNLTTAFEIKFTVNPEQDVYKVSGRTKLSHSTFDSDRYNYSLVKLSPFPKDYVLTYSFSLPTSDKAYNKFFNEIETVADDLKCTSVFKHEETQREAALIDDSKAQDRMALIDRMDDLLIEGGDPYENRNKILGGLQGWVTSAEARKPLKGEVERVYNKPIYDAIVEIYKRVLKDDAITGGTNASYGMFLDKMGELIREYKIKKGSVQAPVQTNNQQPYYAPQQPYYAPQQPYYAPQPYYQQPYYAPPQQPYYAPQYQPNCYPFPC